MRRILESASGLLGLIAALIALTPAEWSQHVADWRNAIGMTPLNLVAGVVVGAMSTYLLYRSRGPLLISADEYERRVQVLLKSGDFSLLKVFGYTGETFLNDIIHFDHRYESLEVRLLHRSWIAESSDEQAYNARVKPSRPWEKSQAIRLRSSEPWRYQMVRESRYYSHHPIVKGVILCSSDARRVAFLTFFNWRPRAAGGGSPFKGTKMWMLVLETGMPGAKALIDYAESQFEYEWAHGETVDDIESKSGLQRPGASR